MTTSSSVNKFRYEGNGVTDTFAFTGRVFSSSDLVVEIILRSDDSLVETLAEGGSGYSVTINSSESASVTVVAGKIPSSLQDIQIRRSLSLTQTLDLPTGTRFPAVSVENALDKVTAVCQDIQEQVNRKVGIPVTDSDEAPDVIELLQDATAGAASAQEAAETAQTAAETAEDNAELQVTYAEEWAQKAEDSAVSVAAGGDASTTFSALHWAAKAAASALTATIGNLFGLTTTAPAGDDFLALSDTSNSNTAIKATATNIVAATLLDEDDFASDSATRAASQQSTAAYIAAQLNGRLADYNLPLYCPIEWDFSWKPSNTIWSNGQSIGDVGSGADIESADLEAYFDLIVAEGTAYGNVGDEVFANGDTVNVPDRCGRVAAGADNMGGITSKNRLTDQSGGVDGDILGDTGGSETHTLTIAQMPSHNHSGTFNTAASAGTQNRAGKTFDGTTASGSVPSQGSGQAHNNVQPTIIKNYIIRYI